MPSNINIRRLALTILSGCSEGQYSNLALDSAIKKHDLTPADRGLLTLLVFGVIEKQIRFDYYIDKLSTIPPSKIEPEVRILLRLGLYQLIFTDRIPDHAAVNETVDLAPRRASGFVNAVLRRYLRQKDKLTLPPPEAGLPFYLSIKYSIPVPLCERFINIFGFPRTESIFSALDKISRLTLRTNTLLTTREDLISQFASAKINASPTSLSPDGISLDSVPLSSLPGFPEGFFFVQDEASQLCVNALDAKVGMLVVDACAAPGSKSFGAAISMKNNGCVLSYDLHENKLSLIQSGAGKLGINIIHTAPHDSKIPLPELFGKADRVLCDVPCSGYGVMAKKPEIRHKNLTDAAALPDIQYSILETCSRYLKPGGFLIYSTCTLLPEENEDNIRRFLSFHPEFTLSPFCAGKLSVPDGMITLTPDIHATDGFFIAKLELKALNS